MLIVDIYLLGLEDIIRKYKEFFLKRVNNFYCISFSFGKMFMKYLILFWKLFFLILENVIFVIVFGFFFIIFLLLDDFYFW